MKTHEHDFRTQAPLGYLVLEVAKLMKRRFEDYAKEHGVTLAQWRALAQLERQGSEPITQRALAGCIDADPMTVSGILDRLEKRGLIERYPDPSDSRAKLARLLPAGVELVHTARQVGMSMYEAATQGLSPQERDAVTTALGKMRENLSGQQAELEEV